LPGCSPARQPLAIDRAATHPCLGTQFRFLPIRIGKLENLFLPRTSARRKKGCAPNSLSDSPGGAGDRVRRAGAQGSVNGLNSERWHSMTGTGANAGGANIELTLAPYESRQSHLRGHRDGSTRPNCLHGHGLAGFRPRGIGSRRSRQADVDNESHSYGLRFQNGGIAVRRGFSSNQLRLHRVMSSVTREQMLSCPQAQGQSSDLHRACSLASAA
jgi:hypothetical protein